jgi:hypothetical protein
VTTSKHALQARSHPRCAVFSLTRNWFADMMLCARDVSWCHLQAPGHLDVAGRNPYELPQAPNADFVFVTSDMAKALSVAGQFRAFMSWAERASNGIVGVDTHDCFRLSMAPDLLAPFDIILKAQGVYVDRDLYNWRAGSFFNGRWTKRESAGPTYAERDLEKLRCSLPCFLAIDPVMRDRLRRWAPGSRARDVVRSLGYRLSDVYQLLPVRPSDGLFFVGALTHRQRLDAVRMLRQSDVPGHYAITNVPDLFFGVDCYALADSQGQRAGDLESLDLPQLFIDFDGSGADDGSEPRLVLKSLDGAVMTVPAVERGRIVEVLRSEGLMTKEVSRAAIHWKAWRHQMVFAPTGYGELTFRHGEALRAGRTLISQDLSHVETLFPFAHGQNVVFCNPDLSDLVETIRSLERAHAEVIAAAGRRQWREWVRPLDDVLRSGISRHLVR